MTCYYRRKQVLDIFWFRSATLSYYPSLLYICNINDLSLYSHAVTSKKRDQLSQR